MAVGRNEGTLAKRKLVSISTKIGYIVRKINGANLLSHVFSTAVEVTLNIWVRRGPQICLCRKVPLGTREWFTPYLDNTYSINILLIYICFDMQFPILFNLVNYLCYLIQALWTWLWRFSRNQTQTGKPNKSLARKIDL